MNRSAPVWFVVAALVAAPLSGAPAKDPVQVLDPVEVKAPPLPKPPLVKLKLDYHLLHARFGAATVTDGPYIYVIGGGDSTGAPRDDIERFDLRTGRSEPFAQLKIARRSHRAVFYLGKIYVLGGYSAPPFQQADVFEDTMEIVDVATGKVTRGPRMPVPKAAFACAISGGSIYVIGGAKSKSSGVATTNSVEAYDIAAGNWSKDLTIPTPRMSMAVNVEGFIIVPGGYSNHREKSEVEVFNPRDKVWRRLPPLHKPVSANSLVFLGHYLFLFAEHELVVYELQTKQSAAFRFDYEAAGDTSAVIADGKVYVIGGRKFAGPALDDYFEEGAGIGPPAGPSTGEAAPRNPFKIRGDDGGLRDAAGVPDYGAMDTIQVFELQEVFDHRLTAN